MNLLNYPIEYLVLDCTARRQDQIPFHVKMHPRFNDTLPSSTKHVSNTLDTIANNEFNTDSIRLLFIPFPSV